jgi:hypothetical protein
VILFTLVETLVGHLGTSAAGGCTDTPPDLRNVRVAGGEISALSDWIVKHIVALANRRYAGTRT